MKTVGIYKIVSPSGAIYIGQSKHIEYRWNQYKRLACKDQPRLFNSLSKYGPDKHEFDILKTFEANEHDSVLTMFEQTYMDYYKIIGCDMMNLRAAAIRVRSTKGTPRVFSEEHKRNISLSKIGKPLNRIGYSHSEETREKIRSKAVNNKGFIGNKNEKSKKAVLQYSTTGEFISEFESVGAAAKYCNGSDSNISSACAGKLKTSGGFIWRKKTN